MSKIRPNWPAQCGAPIGFEMETKCRHLAGVAVAEALPGEAAK
ncbi:hypothetical protein ACFOES_06175 [Acidimangrovimonas pyrenivorans]|uniref:Uncharacterized protein n=1 Tax=Acidimangrovimonas pyrenivorans TaxID=2030798 RepID=A0ABV7AE87_9RHOB